MTSTNDDQEISAALSNLAKIKNGEDPRGPERRDALQVAIDEVDRLWDEHDLYEYLPRERCHVGIANWERRNGVCKKNQAITKQRFNKRVTGTRSAIGSFSVIINERILHESGKDSFLDTVRHEVAHVIAEKDTPASVTPGHDHRWKAWARRLGADPKSCHNKKDTDYKYWYGCPNGCWKTGRLRKSKKIKKANHYRCGTCEATCISWKDGEQMPTEPGTTAV